MDLEFALEVTPLLLKGFGVTLQATFNGTILAMTLGLVWAVARRSDRKWLALPVGGIVNFVRSTPLLVQIYFFFYVGPEFGIKFSPMVTGCLALGIHYSSYTAEVYRAGIEGVPRGQWEAARALNLRPAQTWIRIVIPQAVPPVIPALGNYVVSMFKDTPILSAITVLEVLQTAKVTGSETFRYLEPMTMVGVFFLAASLLAVCGLRALEKRLGRVDR